MADGPDSSSLPERLALSDDDVEFESFFRAGEEGTYKEGPSESFAPVYADVDFDEPDADFYERHQTQLERRGRYRRYVSRGIGSLGAGLALALAVRAVGFHEPEAAPLPESAVPAAAQIPAPGVSAPSAVLPEATSSTGVEPAGVETFEEVIVAGDSPAPPVPAAVAPPVPAAVAPPVPATVAPRALPATVGLRALPVRPPAAAAQLPSSGLEDAPSVASPKGRPSHAKPAPSVAPRPKSLPLGGLQVIGAPASPLFP